MNKSAYLLIVVGIGAAFIVACLLLPEQVAQTMRKKTMNFFSPALRLAEKPILFFSNMDARLKTLDQAQAEVERLRQRVAELQLQNQLLTDKATENSRLREMLGFREASQYRLRACRVISREPSNWWDSVQVNVGWKDEPGLTKDEPVVSPRGVVGKTGNVSADTTEVILMVNENCSISAQVETAPADGSAPDPNAAHEQGIVQGEGNFEEGEHLVKIRYLPKDSQVAIGQFVITSGLGPYFPAGLRLGTIKEVPPLTMTYPTFGLYREAVIETTADLNHLDELFIVLGSKETPKPDSSAPADSGTAPAPDTNSAPQADSNTTPPSNPNPGTSGN